jgi:hypothetical protein
MTELERLKKKQADVAAKLELLDAKTELKEVLAETMGEISLQVNLFIESPAGEYDLDELIGRNVRELLTDACDRYDRALYAARKTKEVVANG